MPRFAAVLSPIALLMTSTIASADVTPEEVWESWQEWMSAYNGEVTVGSETRDGDTLSVENIAMLMDIPDGKMSAITESLTFTDNGDGTVSITMAPEYTVKMNADPADAEAFDMTMRLVQEGMTMLVSGTPDEMSYSLTADSYGVVIDEVLAEGIKQPLTFEIMANELTGNYDTTTGDALNVEYVLNAASTLINMTFEDPETDETAAFSSTIQGLEMTGTSALPEGGLSDNPAMMMSAGLMGDGGYTFDSSASTFSFEGNGEMLSGAGTSEGGNLDVSMDENGVGYKGTTRGLNLNIQTGELPFPLSFAMAEYGFDFLMPLTKSEEPQDFGLALNLSDFTMADALWNMFDPGTILPREPATVSFDIDGKANWFFDLMDPEQAAALETAETPGEIHALDLNNLLIELAGAKLTGDGAFEFDNSDTSTFEGMPRPEGAVNLKLEGGNSLIDKLISMGLLPQEQAMGARMMLGLFATPTGEDELTSKIEVTEDGQVLANGQRLR
ncbi:MAG: DUF2125 domain-containing protein [Pseudomonadota bacterium]